MNFYIESLGCPKNLVDSEIMAQILIDNGYQVFEEPESDDLMECRASEIDFVIINTCAFIRIALSELDEVLYNWVQLKRDGLIKTLVVTGCVMNRAKDDFDSVYPEVDAWVGLKDFAAINKLACGKWKGNKNQRFDFNDVPHAYLRISDGCNNHCSYCTIPSIRGDLKSESIESLVKEALMLQDMGKKELVLIAQDTCSYGIDLYGKKSLDVLIKTLLDQTSFRWVRLMYLHPDNFEREWIQLFKDNPRLLPYFEIPVQHISDNILRAMNRKKNRAEIEELFRYIKSELPEAVFRTTLISGFPGEAKSDFDQLKTFVKETPILFMGLFPYSQEPGTVAAEMPGQIKESIADNRSAKLLNIHERVSEKLFESFVDKKVEVLVEFADKEDDDNPMVCIGRAWFQAPEVDSLIEFQGSNLHVGDFVTVEIDDNVGNELFGHQV